MNQPDFTKPSRELDIHIARIMGYVAVPITDKYWRLRDPLGKLVEMVGDWAGDESRPAEYAWKDAPPFSSNRAAAFELACSFNYREMTEIVDLDYCEVEVGERDSKDSHVVGKMDDFPLLVCRSAAMAKGLI